MRPGGTAGTWTTHFVHTDGLGSVRAITDESGDVVDTRGYEAFGTKNVEAGSETLAYGFAGEAFDTTTHLAYHRARWMDSRVGRFTGMDPWIGNTQRPLTLQKYSYSEEEPVNATDPSGLQTDIESVSVSVSISAVESTLATATPIAQAISIVCTAEALLGQFGVDPFGNSPCSDKKIPVFHGSVNGAAAIRARPGLDPFMLPVFVSRDRAAAEDAIAKSLSTDPNNSAVFESDIPSLTFDALFEPFERPYRGFFPYALNSTEIPLRSTLQVEIWNKWMVP
jgi:RHS repeat-associated protein